MKITKTTFFCALITLAAAGTTMLAAPQDIDPAAVGEEIDPAVLLADSLAQRSNDLYRNILFLKSEGKEKSVLYPAVYEAYEASVEAIEKCEPGSANYNRVRNTLLELDGDLERGAYYYSGQNQSDEMGKFAQAFVDIQLMPQMKDHSFKREDGSFPLIVYIAASRAYNHREFERAIEYFKLYFTTGAADQRQQVFLFMGQACINTKDYKLAATTMRDALRQYPGQEKYLMLGVQACNDGGLFDILPEFLGPALQIHPDDLKLLALQGKIYDNNNDYLNAINIYNRMDELAPMKLSTTKSLALSYYNYAVLNFNDAQNEADEKKARRSRNKAETYFTAAVQKLENVVGSDPMAINYLKALGVSYLCLGEKDKFEQINQQLSALGEDALADAFVAPIITENGTGASKGLGGIQEAPLYSEFAKEYIVPRLTKWAEKGEFVTEAEYTARVNDATIRAEYERLEKEAEAKYLEKYSSQLRLSDLQLDTYDADNQTFLINSNYGPITVYVPLKDNEAEMFKANWSGMRFSNAQYFIVDNKPQIGYLTMRTPDGKKTYTFDNAQALAHQKTDVNIDWGGILGGGGAGSTGKPKEIATTSTTIGVRSDVDKNVPNTGKYNPRTFALVIANENYENVTRVQSALHDGERFAEYCNLTLGLPKENVNLVKNATYGKLLGAMHQLKSTVEAFDGDVDVIVYYAGHGIPDESNGDAYMMPTDALPNMLPSCYSLEKFYADLNDMNSKSVLVFMDACFSGSSRDEKMLYEARGVEYEAKPAAPKGNMFVLSAASGSETALPFKEMNHGLFTYYLLKKLQDSKGNVTLKDLSDYVTTNVKQTSVTKNQKRQTPTVRTSGAMSSNWESTKIVK